MTTTDKSSADNPITSPPEEKFSLIRGDFLYHWQQRLGLMPQGTGLGIPKRVIFLVLITWVPIAVWAAIYDRWLPEGGSGDPLLRHFGIHARLLLALPLLTVAEAHFDRVFTLILGQFENSGLLPAHDVPTLHRILDNARRLLTSPAVFAGLIGAVFVAVWSATANALRVDELAWAVEESGGIRRLGFGGWWFNVIARAIFLLFVLQWLWRFFVGAVILRRIAGLDLQLVPSHPDQSGGLGFLQELPLAFAPVIFALSAVIAAHWGHQVAYHGIHVEALKAPVAVWLAVMVLIAVSPLLMFIGKLARLRRQAHFEYSILVGKQGRLVYRRWIQGQPVDDDALLNAAEIGPVADAISLYEAVARIRVVPFDKRLIIGVALAVLLPMLPVLALEVPLKELLMKLLSALV